MLSVSIYTPGEKQDHNLLGTISWDGRHFSFDPDTHHLRSFLDHSLIVDGYSVTAHDDPEAWLRGLPGHFKSAYLWAELHEPESVAGKTVDLTPAELHEPEKIPDRAMQLALAVLEMGEPLVEVHHLQEQSGLTAEDFTLHLKQARKMGWLRLVRPESDFSLATTLVDGYAYVAPTDDLLTQQWALQSALKVP